MDKSCHSSGEESSAINPNLGDSNSTGNKDQHLKQIHKLSHKISKPQLPIRKPFEFDQIPASLDESQPSNHHHNHQQHQPPVYNVSKSDFRDVVQKLTGSPAHERLPTPPPPPVKPQTSRLHRIRPPPLEHVANRPPAAVEGVVPSLQSSNPTFRPGNFFNHRPHPHQQPLSPLPPLPTVHAAAESPISAYLRVAGFGQLPLPPPPPQQQQLQLQPRASFPPPDFPTPASPLPFGCLPPMLSPRFPFSPTNQFGFQQLTPLSPTPPAPSPRWKSV